MGNTMLSSPRLSPKEAHETDEDEIAGKQEHAEVFGDFHRLDGIWGRLLTRTRQAIWQNCNRVGFNSELMVGGALNVTADVLYVAAKAAEGAATGAECGQERGEKQEEGDPWWACFHEVGVGLG
jgi:hypothetical protein